MSPNIQKNKAVLEGLSPLERCLRAINRHSPELALMAFFSAEHLRFKNLSIKKLQKFKKMVNIFYDIIDDILYIFYDIFCAEQS